MPTATDGIWDYIAEDSIDEADQWIGKLFDAFDAIGNTPGIGGKLPTYRFTIRKRAMIAAWLVVIE